MSDKEDRKIQALERAALDLLDDDESYVLSRDENGKVEVELSLIADSVSTLKETHPSLYGVLIRASAQIDEGEGGCAFFFAFPATLLTIIAGVDLAGLAEVLSISSCLVGTLVGFALAGGASNFLSKRAYRRVRPEVLSAIEKSDLTLDEVILAILGDNEVSDVRDALKLETPAEGN